MPDDLPQRAGQRDAHSPAQADTAAVETPPSEGLAVDGPRESQRPAAGPQPVIAVHHLTKTYLLGQTRVAALRGVSLRVRPGEFVAIMGPSGSGKSTLMNLLGCLDRPTSGEYQLMGTPVSHMSADQLAAVRNRRIGFVFQGFNLLSRATALKNVMLPLLYAGSSRQEQVRRARRALQLVGMGARAEHKPAQLSGGEQQRVAIARALVNGPSLVLADEPTGNLDTRTSIEIIAVLQALNARGLTVVLVTHEPDIAAYTRRHITLRDGRIVGDEPATPHSARAELAARASAGSSEDQLNGRQAGS